MKKTLKSCLALLLSLLLMVYPVSDLNAMSQARANRLQDHLKKGYLELFDLAARLHMTDGEADQLMEALDDAKDACVKRFEDREDSLEKEIEQTQEGLKKHTVGLSDEERHDFHCKIQNLRIVKNQAQTLADHGIPVAYDNKEAKLKLLQEWPEDLKEIENQIHTGAYHERKFGDVKDVGFRSVGEGQKDDIDDGRDAIEQMKRQDLLPPEIRDQVITAYLNNLGEKIAASSDLRVPVKITALNAKEINAFALPGGFVFVQRGLLEAVEDEAQLAGVMSHEIAHAAARHGHQLMKRATIASIIYQVAQVAAVVLTGGAAGIGTYYALQYGFMGLGLVLNLNLLGVSRDFELEADQLGIQYVWKAGIDPTGFIRFFDVMATKKGYVDGLSWFRTHPPFYERMVKAKEELMYLPAKSHFMTNTPEFKQMKAALAEVAQKAKADEKNAPSLLAPEEGCPPPPRDEYEVGQPIDSICGPRGVY